MIKRCNYCGHAFAPNGLHVTEIIEGQADSFSMCDDCLQRLMEGEKVDLLFQADIEIELIGDNSADLVKTAEEIMKLFDAHVLDNPIELPPKDPCHVCGLTLTEFFKNGKFGCSNCYIHFEPEFLSIAEIHQEGSEHMGKRPKKTNEEESPEALKQRLKILKARAIELENYEEAARITEQLRNID